MVYLPYDFKGKTKAQLDLMKFNADLERKEDVKIAKKQMYQKMTHITPPETRWDDWNTKGFRYHIDSFKDIIGMESMIPKTRVYNLLGIDL